MDVEPSWSMRPCAMRPYAYPSLKATPGGHEMAKSEAFVMQRTLEALYGRKRVGLVLCGLRAGAAMGDGWMDARVWDA